MAPAVVAGPSRPTSCPRGRLSREGRACPLRRSVHALLYTPLQTITKSGHESAQLHTCYRGTPAVFAHPLFPVHSPPAIGRSGVMVGKPGMAEDLLPQRPGGVFSLRQASPLQDGHY